MSFMESAQVALVNSSLVFVVLIGLWVVIALISRFARGIEKIGKNRESRE